MVKKPDNARIGEAVYRIAKELQEYISTLEKIRVPVIAAIQGGCVGGDNTANKYLYPLVNKDLDAPFASTIGILY